MVHLVIKSMAHPINPPTLEFREAFVKDCIISFTNIPLVLQCRNIDFGHVLWPSCACRNYYNNEQLMFHIIDNIVDVNVRDNNILDGFTLFDKIYIEEKYANIGSNNNNKNIIKYFMNNGCINNLTFTIFKVNFDNRLNKYQSVIRFGNLVNYLTGISFDRFRGYYNIEKYYYMIHTMLLIMKAKQKLPNTIIKHLIIPFIYQ